MRLRIALYLVCAVAAFMAACTTPPPTAPPTGVKPIRTALACWMSTVEVRGEMASPRPRLLYPPPPPYRR